MARCAVVSGMIDRQPHSCLWLGSVVEEGAFVVARCSSWLRNLRSKEANELRSQQRRRQRCLASAGPTTMHCCGPAAGVLASDAGGSRARPGARRGHDSDVTNSSRKWNQSALGPPAEASITQSGNAALLVKGYNYRQRIRCTQPNFSPFLSGHEVTNTGTMDPISLAASNKTSLRSAEDETSLLLPTDTPSYGQVPLRNSVFQVGRSHHTL